MTNSDEMRKYLNVLTEADIIDFPKGGRDGSRGNLQTAIQNRKHDKPQPGTAANTVWVGEADISGTSGQGSIDISYVDLVAKLGAPEDMGDPKTTAEWNLTFQDGTVAAIYNYRSELRPQENRNWRIGGSDGSVVDLITNIFENPMSWEVRPISEMS